MFCFPAKKSLQKKKIEEKVGKEGMEGSSGGWGEHTWKFNVRAAPWNEDVGFGMKIAISWFL